MVKESRGATEFMENVTAATDDRSHVASRIGKIRFQNIVQCSAVQSIESKEKKGEERKRKVKKEERKRKVKMEMEMTMKMKMRKKLIHIRIKK